METTSTTQPMTKADFYDTIFSSEGREAKRSLLKSLSTTAKMMIEMDPEAGENVNEVILEKMYKNDEHSEFHTFKGWKELGFKVKKGSKSFFIWSKPRKAKKKKEEEQEQEEDKEFKMFGLAYLFSNAQVEPIETNENQQD